jgi:hypothetical protein
VDPDNRLVAAELERRWEAKLHQLQEAEAAYAHFQQTTPVVRLSPELVEQFRHIAQTLPGLWDSLPNNHKKDLLRSLIASIVLTRRAPDDLEVKIVWVSGHFSVFHQRLSTASNAALPDYPQMLTRLHQLWQQHWTDTQIATQLVAEGFHSARSATISPAAVKTIRLQHRWFRPVARPRLLTPGYLNIPDLAAHLDVSPGWVYQRIRDGQIPVQDLTRVPHYQGILIRDDPTLLHHLQLLK